MRYFDKSIFKYLTDLKSNNNKEWFLENKEKYESIAREPFLKFISDFAPHLEKIAPNHQAIAKKTGDSLFRINKDLRFANRDEPYKTWIAAQFKHKKSKDVHSPGFYLHIEPKKCFFGGGIWQPDSQTCQKIRTAIAKNTKEWSTIRNSKRFTSLFEMDKDSLKKPPKGFDLSHPNIEDIIRKNFVIMHALKQKDVTSDYFLERIVDLCENSAKYIKFLTISCGLKWD
ncbi:DUF2461 domain-containing protein [Fluviispira vulneris]|uniref:DUF2461 domain-containing protein n=1 Tax=Fluviispira vulneris TaxID=2763012 RepID=UPI001648AAF2|nr:TIGR02453 family protein [Fluviispira vulneris]